MANRWVEVDKKNADGPKVMRKVIPIQLNNFFCYFNGNLVIYKTQRLK
jgi:hypothetical protein